MLLEICPQREMLSQKHAPEARSKCSERGSRSDCPLDVLVDGEAERVEEEDVADAEPVVRHRHRARRPRREGGLHRRRHGGPGVPDNSLGLSFKLLILQVGNGGVSVGFGIKCSSILLWQQGETKSCLPARYMEVSQPNCQTTRAYLNN